MAGRRHSLLLCSFLFLIALTLYGITLAPVVTFVDSGELAAVIATSGVSHPSGSPFYMLLGSVVALIPAGSLIYRLNALSAVCAAACVAVTFLYLFQDPGTTFAASPKKKDKRKKGTTGSTAGDEKSALRWSGAVAAALAIMTNRALWSTATVTEVYALHALLMALLAFLLGLHAREIKTNLKNPSQYFLFLAALVAGLGVSNYPPFGLVAPAVLVVLWRIEGGPFLRRWRRNLLLLGCVLAGLLPYALLPIRASADPLLNWGNPSSWERFWKHVTAQQYSVFLGSPRLDTLPSALNLWWNQWPAGVWILLIPGILHLRKIRPVAFLFTFVLGFANLVYVLSYDITDVSSAPSDYYVYLLPLCWCSAVWIGAGVGWLLEWLEGTRFFRAATVVAALVPLTAIPFHWKEMDRSRYTYADDFARSVLNAAAPRALILTPDWTFYSPALYLQFSEGMRTDVVVLDGELMRRSWYFSYLQNRAPDLYKACEPAITAFLTELRKYEEGLPYDGNVITEKYVAMLNGLLEEGTRLSRPPCILLNLQGKELNPESFREIEKQLGRPPYVTTGVQPGAIGSGFHWVPETLAFRLYKKDTMVSLPEIRIPPRSFDPDRVYDNVTKGVIERYADFWRYRGDYVRTTSGDCARASEAYRKSLGLRPNPEAQSGLSLCSR